MMQCVLTEPSLSPHLRKGREGKGREQGRENLQDQVDNPKVGATLLALVRGLL